MTADIAESAGADLATVLVECANAWSAAPDAAALRQGITTVEAACADDPGLALVCAWLRARIEPLVDDAAPPDPGLVERLLTWLTLAAARSEDPADPDTADLMVQFLSTPEWDPPASAEEARVLRDALDQTPPAADEAEGATVDAEATVESAVDVAPDTEQTGAIAAGGQPAPPPLSPAVQEMVDLLVAEVADLREGLVESCEIAMRDDVEEPARRDALAHCSEQVGRLEAAAEVTGLAGLHRACTHARENLEGWGERGRPLATSERALLDEWTLALGDYLYRLGGEPASRTLARVLGAAGWACPMSESDSAQTLELLLAPVAELFEEDVPARATTADPGDVSLRLPEDVDPELLDGLLQELPGQTAEFSAAIQRLLDGGSATDLEIAQRVAHTLKGAANTVGVGGVANLTHHLEDILLAFAKHDALPGPTTDRLLAEAADCLEAMSDSLLGRGEPPDDAVAVLQKVLDCANRIDQAGVDSLESAAGQPVPAAAAPSGPAAPSEAAASPEASPAAPAEERSVATVPMMRVPATLIDELLRLAGETLILTGQVQEGARRTAEQAHAMQGPFDLLRQLGHDLERLVDVRELTQPGVRESVDFDPLELDQYNELHTYARRLVEAADDAREMGKALGDHLTRLTELLDVQTRLNRETQHAVLHTRMIEVGTLVPRLQRSVRQASRATGKPVSLECTGADTLMDGDIVNNLADPLMHLLRNAVDHGIESADRRAAAGKDPNGRILVAFERQGNQVLVRCEDDGAGLDWATIREEAEARGMLSPGEAATTDELARLVLRPNFSTRRGATQTSGRGIGMNAVHAAAARLGGSLAIHSETGHGCRIEMRLPLTLVSTHALLVRAAGHLLAVSNRGLQQILHADDGEERTIGGRPAFVVGDAVYPAGLLATSLGLGPDRRAQPRSGRPALLIRAEDGLQAVLVDEVLDSRDLVVKALGRYLPSIRGLAGATILGDGSVTPVLDLPELLRAPMRAAADRVSSETPDAHERERRLPLALVVDDSLSARRSLAQFMSDSGFEVRTARDGIEAIEIIDARRPDLMLVDLEMPRMNGLELTAHVRANAGTHDLPVIMITSRSTAKHRDQALSAGVNRYMTKPFPEDELLDHVHGLLEAVA